MKSTRILISVFLVTAAAFLSGCVTQLKSDITPGTNLKALKTFYVVRLPADQRGTDKLIADRLSVMGYKATSGEKSAVPGDVDAVVTYQDKWMWDITMYMIELNVQVRQPKTEIALATGHSLRTSLVRKSPAAMVEEVLGDLFK
ncbi:MAG: hypothetical protein HY302_07545 [Opitutae bacterium]|nr:hypothetical protein [Opitutae bacterium]